MEKKIKNIGLLGSITHDEITLPSGKIFKGLGGILYPASVLCGLDKKVTLMTHLAEELVPSVLSLEKDWSTINFNGVKRVPGPGNRVKLYYSEQEERQEIMESVVLPLEPRKILSKLPDIDFLVLLMISGMDITLKDWNKVKEKATCPLWMDIHSLALSPEVGKFRKYSPITNWRDWVRGVDYVQANRKEAASMMGYPDINPSEEELSLFGKSVLKQGVRAFFITLSKDGLLVVTPQGAQKLKPEGSNKVVDTTGCGDVFCGAAVSQLLEGKNVMDAVVFGLELATRAVRRSGIREIFEMTKEFKRGSHEK
jgi:hypothetical protein